MGGKYAAASWRWCVALLVGAIRGADCGTDIYFGEEELTMAISISRVELESLIGPECTAWLVSQFGGQAVYIPKRLGAGKSIEAVVGAVAFEVLQAEYGGMNITLPGKPRQTLKDQIMPMIEAGMSHNEIAAHLGCTFRHVAGIKSAMGLTKPQAAQKAAEKPSATHDPSATASSGTQDAARQDAGRVP